MRLIPNKKSGSTTLRVRTLKGTRNIPAGIPLDGAGMRHAEEEQGKLFEDFRHIEVEFDCEKGMCASPFADIIAL